MTIDNEDIDNASIRREAQKIKGINAFMDTDPHLTPYLQVIQARYDHFLEKLKSITETEGSLHAFASSYQTYGLNNMIKKDGSSVFKYKEWAPGAFKACLIGDFNAWERGSHMMTKSELGTWEIEILDGLIAHGSRVKVSFLNEKEEWVDRNHAWIHRTEQRDRLLEGVYWNPPEYRWRCENIKPKGSLRIYEVHTGICTPNPTIATYNDLKLLLPRIKTAGYNVVQLMAVMEHAYYASFGYQVTAFFAPSSRFGTLEELKETIDFAHELGLAVFLDVVHSHACKNTLDGLNEFDGTDHCYFHGGRRGYHDLWDSRLFNYGQHEVLRFLLSNLVYWRKVFRFDGFRFDGVTSMLYLHHGIGRGFSGHYDEYFGESSGVDGEALCYLQLANLLLHQLDCITIAEGISV